MNISSSLHKSDSFSIVYDSIPTLPQSSVDKEEIALVDIGGNNDQKYSKH